MSNDVNSLGYQVNLKIYLQNWNAYNFMKYFSEVTAQLEASALLVFPENLRNG